MESLTPGGFNWVAVTLRDLFAFLLVDLVALLALRSVTLLFVNCFTLSFAFGFRKTFLIPKWVLFVIHPMESADALLDRVVMLISYFVAVNSHLRLKY